jgi:hypothetical protein
VPIQSARCNNPTTLPTKFAFVLGMIWTSPTWGYLIEISSERTREAPVMGLEMMARSWEIFSHNTIYSTTWWDIFPSFLVDTPFPYYQLCGPRRWRPLIIATDATISTQVLVASWSCLRFVADRYFPIVIYLRISFVADQSKFLPFMENVIKISKLSRKAEVLERISIPRSEKRKRNVVYQSLLLERAEGDPFEIVDLY